MTFIEGHMMLEPMVGDDFFRCLRQAVRCSRVDLSNLFVGNFSAFAAFRGARSVCRSTTDGAKLSADLRWFIAFLLERFMVAVSE
jgi:hypothetical protein